MPRIAYEDWKPGPDALSVIAQAEAIASNYQAQGYDLTLRQLYYQFVARDLIPNTDRSYKRLGSIVNKARMAGLLDWDYIVDRTRNIAGIYDFPTPDQMVEDLARGYFEDHWIDQPTHVEVWVEKEALAGVVGRAAGAWIAPYFSCRGYVSQSELWGAAQRLYRHLAKGKNVVILHLGDHDPSGIDMTRDIRDRLQTFVSQDFLNREGRRYFEAEEGVIRTTVGNIWRAIEENWTDGRDALEVRRIALNMDQVEEYDPPPNPAKLTDSRVGNYMDLYGESSWELDALEPSVLDALIQENIEELVDHDKWAEWDAKQVRERARLRYVADRWTEIAAEYDALQDSDED